MKQKLCVLAFLCPFIASMAQTVKSKIYLKPGDQMPNVTISNIVNSKYKRASFSDYKGKVVLLDFWNSWCSSCVEAFPEIDSLQRQYKDRLQVLMVNPKRNHDSPRAVQSVIDRANAWSTHQFKVPVVAGDTAITENFTFKGVPFYVWIGADGKIIAFTGKAEVTGRNIELAIAGKPIVMISAKEKGAEL